MFKKTDPQQGLFGVESSMEEALRARLTTSWATVFRREVLPILMRAEPDFSILYGATGRPNFSVGRMLGICLLQELNDLSDQEALDTFGFDLRWRHALDVSEPEAYLSRRSLVEFRRRLVAHDPEMQLVRAIFEQIGNAAIEKLGISTGKEKSDGGRGDVKHGDAGQREISGGRQAEANEVEIDVKKKTEGESLQSAFDTDASYGHKGAGYSAHITETCNNADKPEIITDYEVHGAHRSDIAKMSAVLDRLQEAELAPETLFADGGYPSVPSAQQMVERGVELVAPVNRGRLDEQVMSREQFRFNGDGQVIACPDGHRATDHRILSANNGTDRSLYAIFDGDVCRQCSRLERCPVRAPNHREKGCDPQKTVGDFRLEITDALRLRDAMFERQKTREWKQRYKIRSGVEATMSELKRIGMGKLRVRGLSKVIFAVACKVIACNIKRWWRAVIAATGGQSPLQGTDGAANLLFCALSGLLLTLLAATRQRGAVSAFIEYIPSRQNDHMCIA